MLPINFPMAIFPLRPVPVFRIGLDGAMRLSGAPLSPTFRTGTTFMDYLGRVGIAFDGLRPGIGLGDPVSLRLTKSMSISCWLKVDEYAPNGSESQVVFRGDDRGRFDPYTLRVLANGRVAFQIEDDSGKKERVSNPIVLHTWTHVIGSLDDRTSEMSLWINDKRVDHRTSKIRPFGPLDPKFQPGVSVGNVQREGSIFNQPYKGIVADLAIYDRAVTPTDISLSMAGWIDDVKADNE